MSLKILIIGAGNVGGALGRGWLARGHDVRFGVTDPANPAYAALPKERLQSAGELRGAQVVVLATPYAATKSALETLGDLGGAILIDCTNPFGMGPGGMGLTVGPDSSGAEEVAAVARNASVFKALNQTGAENLVDAAVYHPKPMMLVAGDDAARKPTVLGLVADLGFEAVDAGPLRAARLLEPLGLLWVKLAMMRGRHHRFAFAIVPHPTDSR